MERVAIEAVRLSRALTGDNLQRHGKASYKAEVPSHLNKNDAFSLRQRPHQPFAMIPHARQVIVLCSIDTHGNGDFASGASVKREAFGAISTTDRTLGAELGMWPTSRVAFRADAPP
jgi:hypothetical protein